MPFHVKNNPLGLAEDRILVEQLRLLMGNVGSSVIPAFLLALLLLWTLSSSSNEPALMLWCAAVILSKLTCYLHARRHLASNISFDPTHRLTWELMILNAVDGALWGALTWATLDTSTLAGSILVVSVAAGIAGSSMSLLSPVLPVFVVFALAELAALASKILLLGDPAYNALGIAGILYAATLLGQARNSALAARVAIDLRFELADSHQRLRESEEFLKGAQHIAGLGSYVLDIPGGRWKGTDSIPQMFGMDASYEQTYEAWAKLVHPDDRAMITDYFANLIHTRNEVFDKGYRIIRHDNQAVRWLHGIGRLSFDAQGQPTKMLGTIRDVTEQHAREAELAATHERLREIERRQTLSQERQRLVQDMHDGLGSSLVSALRVVEHGRMDEIEVAQVLQGCIDDLQLAIDSMEPVEADLLLLLATLRYRLGSRLESTGIALRWEVENIPALDWLDPKNALHILRILQEAFTNTIKHTHATEIRVATRVDGDQVLVSITDNGQGFALESALEKGGKGLSNQMRRAQSIGAEVNWDSNGAGTCFTLRLPIKQGSATRV